MKTAAEKAAQALKKAAEQLEVVYQEYIEALGGSPEYVAPFAYNLSYWQNHSGIKRVHQETLMRQWENDRPVSADVRKRAERQGLPIAGSYWLEQM